MRATKDVDIVPEPSRENMERHWDALAELKARPAEFDAFGGGEGNRAPYTALGRIDVMPYVEAADSEIAYGHLRGQADEVTLEEIGTPIYVTSLVDLIAMKEHASRDIDRIDLTALRMAHGQEE